MSHFTVATLNTWNCQGRFSRRLTLMTAGLRKLDADVILLQEVFAQAPVGIHVGERLADALGLFLSFVPARKKLRTLGGAPILGHSGLAVLSKTPVLKSRSIRLPMDTRDGERLGQVASLRVRGLLVQVGNVHLTHLPDGDILRRRQLETLVDAFDTEADFTVLGGDMNAPTGHALFQTVSAFTAPDFATRAPSTSLNDVNGTVNGTGVIDHLFMRPAQGRKARAIVRPALHEPDARTGLYASDHMAMVMDVNIL